MSCNQVFEWMIIRCYAPKAFICTNGPKQLIARPPSLVYLASFESKFVSRIGIRIFFELMYVISQVKKTHQKYRCGCVHRKS